jgi:dihydroorotate dehydrogenase electron transfer subunit
MRPELDWKVAALRRKTRSGGDCQTLFFDASLEATPGQFVMIWVPGVDEVPMSISHIGEETGITVRPVGEATKTLCALQKGGRVRLRGPFGRGFNIKGDRPILVAGGVGIAPLLPLASVLVDNDISPIAILGAKTKGELVLTDAIKEIGVETLFSTDDGTLGHKGTASALLEETIDSAGKIDTIYTCGPEQMIASVAGTAAKWSIWGQAALERIMKCGIGLCGSCAINHELVCRNGPVFDLTDLKGLREFGNAKRDSSGRLVHVKM